MAQTIDLRKTKEDKNKKQAEAAKGAAIGKPVFIPEKETMIPARRPVGARAHVISWQAPLVIRNEESRIPYVIVCILLISAGLLLYFREEITMAILFALMGVMLIVHKRRAIPLSHIELGPSGVGVSDARHPYESIDSFAIQEEKDLGIYMLSIKFKKWYRRYLRIPLAVEPSQVRDILLEYIPEETHEQAPLDIIIRRIGL